MTITTSNWANRTMWIGDILDIMRGMNPDIAVALLLALFLGTGVTYSVVVPPL